MIYQRKEIPAAELHRMADSIAGMVEAENLSLEQCDELFAYIIKLLREKPIFRRVDRLGREIEKIETLALPTPDPLLF